MNDNYASKCSQFRFHVDFHLVPQSSIFGYTTYWLTNQKKRKKRKKTPPKCNFGTNEMKYIFV